MIQLYLGHGAKVMLLSELMMLQKSVKSFAVNGKKYNSKYIRLYKENTADTNTFM